MLTLETLLKSVAHLSFRGNPLQEIVQVVKLLDAASNSDLCWCSDKNMHLLPQVKTGTVVCSNQVPESSFNPNCNYIITENPRLTFQRMVELHFSDQQIDYSIHPAAVIHPNSKIASNVKIDACAVIEEGCEIGEFTCVGAHTVLLKRTKVGSYVKIGCNNTIGGIGFGYEKNEEGQYKPMPHLGNVVIEDHVEIGNNNSIDRAVMGATLLKKNCKIDNLVHIAHGVEIGENSLIIANAMIGGSTRIGKNVWIAPSASILNKLVIGDNAVIGMGAVVIRNVENGQTIIGNPGKVLKKND